LTAVPPAPTPEPPESPDWFARHGRDEDRFPPGGPFAGTSPGSSTTYYCEAAWLGGEKAVTGVVLTVGGGHIRDVQAGVSRRPAGVVHLRGLTLPGLANAHSHAFHRVLRARTERPGDFWGWRDQMYRVAAALDPDLYLRLARAVYAEMALAGWTAVGEFHYVHHPPAGGRYGDRNEMGLALAQAAAFAGVRLTLLDACYLESAPGRPAEGVQVRFSDGDVSAWADRVDELATELAGHGKGGDGAPRVGAAVHSLRAVPPAAAGEVAAWARARGAHDRGWAVPLHVHVSEQPAENDAVADAYGAPPVALLADAGVLGKTTTAVHATHLHPAGAATLGGTGTTVCMCPTTERALADGIGLAGALSSEGCPIALGSDSHAVVDPFEEMRALELDERLASLERGRFSAPHLLLAASAAGHASIGWPEGGRLAPGAPADLVTVSLTSVRLAGATPDDLLEHAVFAAGASDVTDVVVGGRRVVEDGEHLLVGDVAAELRGAIGAVLEAMDAR
jgi:formiminoglutamate deiminase